MDPATLAAAVIGSMLATVGFDVALNVAQDYYDTFYADVFWSTSGRNPEIEARLRAEELEIDRLFQHSGVGAVAPTTIRAPDGTVAALWADPSGKGRPGLWAR